MWTIQLFCIQEGCRHAILHTQRESFNRGPQKRVLEKEISVLWGERKPLVVKMVSSGTGSSVLGRWQAEYSSWNCKAFSAGSVLLEVSPAQSTGNPPAVQLLGTVVIQVMHIKNGYFSFSFITMIFLYVGCIACMQLCYRTILWIDAFLVLTSAHKKWVFIYTVWVLHFSDYVRRLQNWCALHLQPLGATSQSQSNIKGLHCLGEEDAQHFARMEALSAFYAINYLWL